ncbi:MAG TPA: pectate lyase [Opitutaceae bacterium]|nr:pectate lyase [Opitutaceae bacterium]
MNRICRLAHGGALFAVALVASAQPPKSWPADAFLPLTAARIAALPAAQRPAWERYWEISLAQTKLLPARDLAEHSSNKPLDTAPLGASYSKGVDLGAKPGWYATEAARAIADHVVTWQTIAGGWTKSGDYSRDRRPEDDHRDAWSAGTFDNDATIHELRYLVRVAASNAAAPDQAARVAAWRASFLRGLDYILAAQYPNGGIPQIYPLAGGYHDAITFNDDAMEHALDLLHDVAARRPELAFVPVEKVARARDGFERGLHCILAAQLRDAAGAPTVWAQQVDSLTLAPCAARNFEPIAACSQESAGVVEFLLTLDSPSPEVIAAVDGAMAWFRARALHGVVWNRNATTGSGLESRPGARDLWARFYELGTDKPIFGDRDRTIHYIETEISFERRRGYAWFGSRPADLFSRYEKWRRELATSARKG